MYILRIVAMGLIAACLPMAAYADDVVLTNDGGTFTSNTGGTAGTIGQTNLPLTGSYLVGISGLSGLGIANQSLSLPCDACLGTVTLTTGTMTSGVLNQAGSDLASPIATFGAGGSFTVTGAGFTFAGTFSGDSWSKPQPGMFTFQGTVVNAILTIGGATYQIASAVTLDLTTNGTGEIGTGTVSLSNDQGTTNFLAPSPEPGALTLLGTGLIGIGILVRRIATA